MFRYVDDPLFCHYMVCDEGYVINTRTNHQIIGDINSAGYRRITLYNKQRKKRFFLHRLVGEYFVPNPYNFPVINHKDHNKLNNHYSNLEWCTCSYNNQDIHLKHHKPYRPFILVFDNGVRYYRFTSEAACELHCSRRTVLNILQQKISREHQLRAYNILQAFYC